MKKLLILLLVSVFGLSSIAQAEAVKGPFTPAQTKQIEKITHDYLVKNPQVIVQALQSLQEKRHQAMIKKANVAIKAHAKQLFNSPSSPVVGDAKGKVTVVEFFDYQCPHCKVMAKRLNNILKSNPKLRVVYKEFPIFPGSEYIAKMALASVKQGKYQAFHNALISIADPVTKKKVLSTAKKLGLNIKKLEKDMRSKTIANEIKANRKLAIEMGLIGTPAFVVASNINNPKKLKIIFIPGQVPEKLLRQAIKEARAAAV